MGQKRAGAPTGNTLHRWVAGATLAMSEREARFALLRGYVVISPMTRVDVFDVYCSECRRPYDEVADELCVAAEKDREHLHGGPIGERKRRSDPPGDNLTAPKASPQTLTELPRRTARAAG